MSDYTIPMEEEINEKAPGVTERVSVAGSDLIKTVQALLREAAVRKITVQDKTGRTLIEIPLYAGVIGALLIGSWTVLALVAAWFAEVSILIERDPASDGEPSVIGEAVERSAGNVSTTVSSASTTIGTAIGGAARGASGLARRAADSLEGRMAHSNGNGHAAEKVTEAVAEAVAEPQQCVAFTKAGTRCKRTAMHGSAFCSTHQPA